VSDNELSWYWLSFSDPHNMPGHQFLGACFVPGTDSRKAIERAHNEHCFPGDVAEVVSVGPISEIYINNKVPRRYRCVLLNQQQMTEELGWDVEPVYRR
jgi:hypothetical protein